MVWCFSGYWRNLIIIMIRNKRVIDAFLFFNEIEIALFRMEALTADVDVFVILEAKHTFSGKSKPLHFFNNREKFKKFKNKIVYRVFRGGNSCVSWDNETAQRNYMKNIFGKICFEDDLICVSDVDEIPKFSSITPKHLFDKPCVFIMDMFTYSWKFRLGQNIWTGTKMMLYNSFKLYFHCIQDFRTYNRDKCMQILDGGWHLTYFGGAEKITDKLNAFSHTELNIPEFNNLDNINKSLHSGDDLFKRGSVIEHIEYENTGLPKHLKKYL